MSERGNMDDLEKRVTEIERRMEKYNQASLEWHQKFTAGHYEFMGRQNRLLVLIAILFAALVIGVSVK